MYIGPIYVGEKRQKIDVVWDTGSDWLVIANSKCKTCDGPNPFVRKDSSTFTQLGEKNCWLMVQLFVKVHLFRILFVLKQMTLIVVY